MVNRVQGHCGTGQCPRMEKLAHPVCMEGHLRKAQHSHANAPDIPKPPSEESFAKNQSFKKKKAMAGRFPAVLDTVPMFAGAHGCCTFVRLQITGSSVE